MLSAKKKKLLLEYHAMLHQSMKSGVVKKIRGTVKAAQNIGLESKELVVDDVFGVRHLRFLLNLVITKADIVIIRNALLVMLFCLPVLILLRLRGVRVIIDVPTPISIAIKEWKGGRGIYFLFSKIKFLLVQVSYPLCFLPSNTVLEYSAESPRYVLFCEEKVLLTSNTILSSMYSPDITKKKKKHRRVTLLSVANLSFWHGYDRLLNGVHEYRKSYGNGNGIEVAVLIVGEGEEKEKLEFLTGKLGLNDVVKFLGYRDGDSLKEIYRVSDVAVASLGLHRKGLSVASEIKMREYAFNGLPIVYSSDDVDFCDTLPFVLKVDRSDEPIRIQKVVEWYLDMPEDKHFNEIITFARKELLPENKLRKVLQFTMR